MGIASLASLIGLTALISSLVPREGKQAVKTKLGRQAGHLLFGISEDCDQIGDTVSENDISCHICIRRQKVF